MTITPSDAPERTAVLSQDWLPGYELLGVLGSGGFGTVYKARQLKLDRLVAVKVIRQDLMADPTQASRFETEAVLLGKFRHPNIVQVFDLGNHNDRLFLAEELLDGEDLGALLKRVGRLPEKVAWHVARQAAAGLAHAAEHGVVHRDVKPANLFLAPPPTGVDWPEGVPLVKVTDFGIAHVAGAVDAEGFTLTQNGSVVGTPAYMAPEQHQSVDDLDHRADIYALGATVAQALTGHPPFAGKTPWDVMANKIAGPVTVGPEVSAASASLVRAMTAPDRAERLATYEELTRRIDVVLAEVSETDRVIGRRFPRPGRRVVAVVALAATAVAAGGWYSLKPVKKSTRPPDLVNYVSTGEQTALFDGKPSVLAWLAPEAGGIWTVEKDEEKTPVLIGSGFTRRSFRSYPEYRITIGVDPFEASTVELHFGIPKAETGPRYVLRISPTGGAVLGTRTGNRGPFVTQSETIIYPPKTWFADRRRYLEAKIERTTDAWRAWFNGRLVGTADRSTDPTVDEFRLVAGGGRARIDTALIEPIRPED
jgi:serine/threonine protein kinase